MKTPPINTWVSVSSLSGIGIVAEVRDESVFYDGKYWNVVTIVSNTNRGKKIYGYFERYRYNDLLWAWRFQESIKAYSIIQQDF